MEEPIVDLAAEAVATDEIEIEDRIPQDNQPHPDDHLVQGDDENQTPGNEATTQRPQRNRQAPARLKDYVVNRLRRAWGGE